MAYRDDNEALQAKVKGLQEELSKAKSTIDELQGVADFARPDLLPKRSHGFKARARTINGPVDAGAYERIAQVLQRAGMDTDLVDGTFTATSKGVEIAVLQGEDDELFLVFDERSPTNYRPTFALSAFFLLITIGAAQEDGWRVGLCVLVIGALLSSIGVFLAKRRGQQVQTDRSELFATIGGLLQRSAVKVRAAEQEEALAEVPVDEDVPLENEA